jgi:mRNA interferase MazF
MAICRREMNEFRNTVIVAPMTTKGFVLPSRISITYGGKKGLAVLDQIRTVDKQRLQKRLRKTADLAVVAQVLQTLIAMFSV